MSVTFTSPAIATSFLKVKWREQHGSAGINKKLYGIVPHGIYRGLTLGTSGSNNTITVVPDPTYLDHLAVYETADGYSVTLRDDTNTTYSLDLSNGTLLSQTVVIAIFVEYKEGFTSANFVAYQVAEFNSLSASLRNELIVLGTVVNPAAGNTISASSITSARRTVAAFGQSMLSWKPLLANPGFERSLDSDTITGFEVEGWATSGAASWQASSTDVSAGTKCLQFDLGTPGAGITSTAKQAIGASVVAGQRVYVKMSKKIVGLASAGTGQIVVGFTGNDGGTAVEQSVSFDITIIDGSYQSVDNYFTAPAGAVTLAYVGFGVSAATYATGGVKVRVDDIQAYLEPKVVSDHMNFHDERLRRIYATAMIIEDFASTSFGDTAAAMSYDLASPASEGTLKIGRKDNDFSGGKLPPAVNIQGRLLELGSKLLGTEADALKPRISADIGIAGATDFTLMWESGRAGEDTGTYTQPAVRIYASIGGELVMTSNAMWGGATWVKDVAGMNATKMGLAKDGMRLYTRVVDAAWADNAWDATTRMTNPLDSAASSLVSRHTTTLREGSATSTDYNLLSQFEYSAHRVRVYSSFNDSALTINLMVVFNASWNGTNWVKDVASRPSSRIRAYANVAATVGASVSGIQMFVEMVDETNATFAESLWGDITSVDSSGGGVSAGKVSVGYADKSNWSSSGIARIQARSLKTASVYDTTRLMDLGENFLVNASGMFVPDGAFILEEFNTAGLPARWLHGGAAGGAVTYNVDGLTRITLSGGTSAFIYTEPTVAQPAYCKIATMLRYNDVTGTSFFGLTDGAFNHDFGFRQDSATYGDENIRLVLRTGAGLQVLDTGVSPAGKGLNKWAKLHAYCSGGTGLVTNATVYWEIYLGIAGSASGCWAVGAAPVNATTGRHLRIETTGGNSISVERVYVGGMSDIAV